MWRAKCHYLAWFVVINVVLRYSFVVFCVCHVSVSDTAEIFPSLAPPRLKVRGIVASFVANVPANTTQTSFHDRGRHGCL